MIVSYEVVKMLKTNQNQSGHVGNSWRSHAMAGPEEEIGGNCLQAHKDPRASGWNLEEPRKRLARLGLDPTARQLPKGRSSSRGVRLSSQRCVGEGAARKARMCRRRLSTYIHASQANAHMRTF